MPVKPNPERDKSDKLSAWLIFIALNLIALPFSAYQTFKGYEHDMGLIIAGAIAALTTVFFIAINYEIARRRRTGRSIAILFLLYILPLAFSFPGNFGAFYSQFTDTLRQTQWDSKTSRVELNVDEAEAAVERCDVQWSNRSKQFKTKRTELEAQYNDPSNRGFGEKCEKIYADMAKLLNVRFQTSTDRLEPRLDEADKQYEAKRQEVLDALTCLRGALNQCREKLNEKVGNQNWSAAQRGTYLNQLKLANDKLVNCVNSKCGSDLELIDALEDTDGLNWAFKSAYVDGESGVNAVLCTILALVIDLGVLLFILILFKPEVRGRLTGRA